MHTTRLVVVKPMSSVIIGYEYATVSRLDLIVVKQMQDPNSDHCMHTTPTIPQLLILFCLFLILLFQMSVYMRRLEENGQPLQRVGNRLMIKMVKRGNRRINIEHKWRKMKKCLTQIQSNKIVSIKLSFSMSIQGGLLFLVKISVLTQIVRDLKVLGNIKTIFSL